MNRTGTAATAAALLLALAACSGDDAEAGPTPSATTTASPAPTPSEKPPEMPEQAQAAFPEGAPAFTKYYVDVLNYAARTGDVSRLRELSGPRCAGCEEYIDGFDGVRLDRDAALWELGNEVELHDVAGGKAVVASVAALRDNNKRETVSLVFVVSSGKPRTIIDLYLRES